MKKTYVFLLICVASFLYTHIMAQDVIKLNDGRKINAKILEINDYEVKYHEYNDPNKLTFTISRAVIKEIKFEYGKVIEQTEPKNDENYYYYDKKNNIKLNFTALSDAAMIWTYERSLNQFSSLETSIKLNGVGINNDNLKSGYGLSLGYKIKAGSVFKDRYKYRPDHLLHGGYFRPSIGFNSVSFGRDQYFYTDYNYFNFGIDYGKQWIMHNLLAIDLFIGYHYFVGKAHRSNIGGDIRKDFEISDGDLFGDDSRAFSIGLRFGLIFDKNKGKGAKKR